MAAALGRKDDSLIAALRNQPHRFNFFQAVRILEWLQRVHSETDDRLARLPVGRDNPPDRECVRFRVSPTMSFPGGQITGLQLLTLDQLYRAIDVNRDGAISYEEFRVGMARMHTGLTSVEIEELIQAVDADGDGTIDMEEFAQQFEVQGAGRIQALAAPEMTVAFMGLTGPAGVLPNHYTSMIVERVRRYNDTSMRDFFDLFNHRTISLFFRAWQKYHVPSAYERSLVQPDKADLITEALYSMVGMGTDHLRGRQSVADETFLLYAGHFSHHPRSAAALRCMLSDYLNTEVEIEQFSGRWLYLDAENQSRAPSAELPRGQYMQLGVNVVVGDRVWDVKSSFRIRLGPLTYEQFCRFMPTGDALRPICDLTRSYVGVELSFDVQPILMASEVPFCQLGGEGEGARLGWNTWVQSAPPEEDVTAAVFSLPV